MTASVQFSIDSRALRAEVIIPADLDPAQVTPELLQEGATAAGLAADPGLIARLETIAAAFRASPHAMQEVDCVLPSQSRESNDRCSQ